MLLRRRGEYKLLLGKTTSAPDMSNAYYVSVERFTESVGYVEQVEAERWKLWYTQCAAGLIFYSRGDNTKVQDNFQINNVVLVLTVTKMGKRKYKICHVKKTFSDSDRNVRLVEVEMWLTRSKKLMFQTISI